MAGERSKGLSTRGKVLLSLFGGLIPGGLAATIVSAMMVDGKEVTRSTMGFEETVAVLAGGSGELLMPAGIGKGGVERKGGEQ